MDLDAKTPVEAVAGIPVKLTGRTGQIVKELYTAGQKGKNFDKIVKELEQFVAAIQDAGLVVDRFFTTANYSEVECKKVISLLLTNAEPLTSFASIKDADVKDIIVDNEGNVPVWQAARKAVQAIGLTDASKAALEAMAGDANLSRVKRVAAKAAEVRSVTSKTLDVTVASAVALTKAQQEAVTKALPQYIGGASVAPVFTVDPAVLGGLMVSFRNQTIDLSATTRLVEVVASKAAQLA